MTDHPAVSGRTGPAAADRVAVSGCTGPAAADRVAVSGCTGPAAADRVAVSDGAPESSVSAAIQLTATTTAGWRLATTTSLGSHLTATASAGSHLAASPARGRRLAAVTSADRRLAATMSGGRRLATMPSAGSHLAATTSGGRHLAALDVVRVLTVGLVIAVHTVSLQPGGIGWSNGAVLMAMHVSREVFFLLTAFVLTYADRGQPWPAFWRRRFLLVGVPYLVWSAIYVLASGQPSRFPVAVLTGTASYHLYFLLVSMQLYLVFPLLRRLLRATAGHHRALFVAAVVYQLAAYGTLPHLIAQPDALLISYGGFVVVGGIAAVHAPAFLAWTGRHRRAVLLSALCVIVGGSTWFAARTVIWHDSPTVAAGVFQPAIVIESMAVAWAFLALGLTWHRPIFQRGADVSFGVYLAHPLLLQGLLATGLGGLVAGLAQPLVTFLALTVAVPAVYLICAVVVSALRRTRLSLALTGHPARPPASRGPAPGHPTRWSAPR